MKLADKKVMIALFLSMFVAIEIGDQLAGMLTRLGVTVHIYGLAGFLAHCIVGVGYGYAFSKAPVDRLNLLVLMLLPMALVCGALQSAVLFMLDDRIFYVTKWLAYILTSKFGFQWLIVVPVSAYFAAKRFARRIA